MELSTTNLQRGGDGRLARITRRAHHDDPDSRSSVAECLASGTEPNCAIIPEHRSNSSSDRRRHARVAVDSALSLRNIGASAREVVLEDISSGGCRVLLEPAAIDDRLIARLPQLEPLGSTVRWTAGGRAGVEFRRAIHSAVLDLLVGRLGGVAE